MKTERSWAFSDFPMYKINELQDQWKILFQHVNMRISNWKYPNVWSLSICYSIDECICTHLHTDAWMSSSTHTSSQTHGWVHPHMLYRDEWMRASMPSFAQIHEWVSASTHTLVHRSMHKVLWTIYYYIT